MDQDDAATATGLTKLQIYALIRCGKFPTPTADDGFTMTFDPAAVAAFGAAMPSATGWLAWVRGALVGCPELWAMAAR